MTLSNARSLDDSVLTTRVKTLAAAEREATVALIVHLAEFDQRQLYRGAGFPSLFQYCVEVLRLSEDAASNRIAAARMARRHPDVMDRLVAGSLSPTTVRLIAKHATVENAPALIDAATGKTKRQVEQLLARLFPEQDVRTSIRPLGPAPSPPPSSRATSSVGTIGPTPLASTIAMPLLPPTTTACPLPSAAVPDPALPHPTDTPSPVSLFPADPLPPRVRPADRFEIRFTAKADTVANLEMVRDLLAHAVPNADLAEVLDRALTALAEQLLRRKFAVTSAPRRTPSSHSVRREPVAVKRAVYLRDRGRCTYSSSDGRRCDARRFLQFDHILGRALGGRFTVDNVRLRCGPHNRLEAERLYATPPRARDAGGGRVDLTRFVSACVEPPSVPGRMAPRTNSERGAST